MCYYQVSIEKKQFEFKKPAKTSRGSYVSKEHFFISVHHGKKELRAEIAPLFDLSVDGSKNIEKKLKDIFEKPLSFSELTELYFDTLIEFPTIAFGLDVLLKKIEVSEKSNLLSPHLWVDNAFTQGKKSIEINGLVWMSELDSMYNEASVLLEKGFGSIKLKVGCFDVDRECNLLEKIRKHPQGRKTEIRLDANGAYSHSDVFQVLKEFSRFEIHSIEQPIARNQWEAMQEITHKGAIKIALDEELIGVDSSQIMNLLTLVKPHFLILKPTLLGGFSAAEKWINAAEKQEIKWWVTSALESNLALFDIAQWVSEFQNHLPQGLGTGALYKENITMPFVLNNQWFTAKI